MLGSKLAECGFWFSVILSLLWVNCAFSDGTPDKAVTPPEFETINVGLMPGGGRPSIPLSVKLATTEAQRRHGLMFTSHLPDQHGMLFVFKTDAVRKFWMKNTPIPLDILFFDSSGRLVSLIPSAKPFSLTFLESTGPARYALEINGGHSVLMDVQADAKLLLQ